MKRSAEPLRIVERAVVDMRILVVFKLAIAEWRGLAQHGNLLLRGHWLELASNAEVLVEIRMVSHPQTV